MDKRYKLGELKLGMRVTSQELSDIKDTHIVLYNARRVGYMNIQGIIGFIGKEITAEVSKLDRPGASLYDAYIDSTQDSEDFFYDE